MSSSDHFSEQLIRALLSAERVVVLTGSGVSAESGIPTFRQAQTGLWSRYDPLELATPQAFKANPQLVWQWYDWRRQLIASADPNPGHKALVGLQRRIDSFTLITQNVDGLHQQAGSRGVIELHGNIVRTICSVERVIVDHKHGSDEFPPRCPECGSYLRPDVVWFGESLPPGTIDAAVDASANCDLFLSVGTSAVVQPAASLAHIAGEQGAYIAEINVEPTPLTAYADFSARGKAGELLPALLELVT
jgi:NAD-dependent deacetylase